MGPFPNLSKYFLTRIVYSIYSKGFYIFIFWRKTRFVLCCVPYIFLNTFYRLYVFREVLILTRPILISLWGCNSWYIPRDGLLMREWPYTNSSRDVLYPYTAERRDVLGWKMRPWDPGDFPRAREISKYEGRCISPEQDQEMAKLFQKSKTLSKRNSWKAMLWNGEWSPHPLPRPRGGKQSWRPLTKQAKVRQNSGVAKQLYLTR